eukprot:g6014.t1
MGIVLEQFDDYIEIESIVPNSQASKYSSLAIGSILEKVGNEASNKNEMEMLSRKFEETLPLVARVNNVADQVSENLGEYTDFVSEMELSKIAIGVSGIAPEDVEASYWSDPDEFDSAGENYGGSGLSSYISSSDDDGGD